MRRHQRICMWSLGFVFSLSVASGLVTIAAAHTIDAVTVTPAVVVLEEGAAVTVTAEIADKDVFQRSVHVQQQGTDGQWRIAGLMEKTDKTRWTYTQTVSTTAVLRLRVGAIFRQPWEVVVSSAHLVRVGQVVEPAEETIVSGPEGVQLRVLPGALNVPAVLTVAPVPTEEVAAPLGSRPVVAAVDVVVEPVEDLPGLIYLVDQPFELSLPLPEGLSATDQFYVAVQGLADVVDEGQEGIAPRLIVVDTGVVEDGRIVSQATDLAGIFSSGRYVVQQKIGSGFVEGVVTDPLGNPRAGVAVRVFSDMNSTTGEEFENQDVFYTDADGRYKLVINGDSFVVVAADVLGCSGGNASGNLPGNDATVSADITVVPITSHFIATRSSRHGIRNGGFEVLDSFSCLTKTILDVTSFLPSIKQAGELRDLAGLLITPMEGSRMMALAPIQLPSVSRGTHIFKLPLPEDEGNPPNNPPKIYFDVNHGCEGDCPVGPVPFSRERLMVSLTDNNDLSLPLKEIHSSDLVGGWTQFSFDLPPELDPSRLFLVFTASQEQVVGNGDTGSGSEFVSWFLVDNLRFNTIWVDVKIVAGSGATEARVRQNVRDTNEILAQTGLNVRIRNIQTIADPGGLLDTDVSLIPSGPKFLPTTEEQALLGLARSTTDTDINVYYVRSLTGLGSEAWGIAIGPDDYVLTDAKKERGIILADLTASGSLSELNQRDLDRELLAHELGHMLIPAASAGGDREHGVEVDDPDTGLPVADTTNIMQSTRCKTPDNIMTTQPCFARTFFNTDQTEFIQLRNLDPDNPDLPHPTLPNIDRDFIDPANP